MKADRGPISPEQAMEVRDQARQAILRAAMVLASSNPDKNVARQKALEGVQFGQSLSSEAVFELKRLTVTRVENFIRRTPTGFALQRKAAWWNSLKGLGFDRDQVVEFYLIHCWHPLTQWQVPVIERELRRRLNADSSEIENWLKGKAVLNKTSNARHAPVSRPYQGTFVR